MLVALIVELLTRADTASPTLISKDFVFVTPSPSITATLAVYVPFAVGVKSADVTVELGVPIIVQLLSVDFLYE